MDGIKSYFFDLIDILIVSFIIYQLLILLRGTKAFQLLKGIGVVIGLWVISNFFHLRTVQWLIENFFSVGVIAIIIIFQPELRRALEQIGRGRFFGRVKQSDEPPTGRKIAEIAKAVVHLAKRHIGALIVIERKTGLTDYIETGISLEAKLSAELLKNIFLPNTPLHDGAVIIRDEQIMAAGCYLPLSENPLISKELGTRHRAGIGLSEISDAVIIIVSEETGQISIAIHGKLERGLTEDELVSRLYEEIKSYDKSPSSFWIRKVKGGTGL